jgi:uncharacterized membrane protein (UPF0127 family)
MNIEGKKISNIGSFKIGGQEYDVYIAKTKEQKEKGLQFFESLPKDEGMLFTNFDDDSPWFHMKNVGMDLDLVGLDDEMNVIKIIRGKAQDPTPLQFKGVTYVLEVNADSGIKEGEEGELDDEDTHKYVMKVLDKDGNTQMHLEGGERIVSRKETVVLIRKALKASLSKEDKDYKSLGKYIFKVLKGQDGREPEYVDSPEKKK